MGIPREMLIACAIKPPVPPPWSGTRGVFAGGNASTSILDTIDYVSIGNTGNAIDFGNLTVARFWLAGCSNGTRGIFGGGQELGHASNIIDYITIATTGDATSFGILTQPFPQPNPGRSNLGACSDGIKGVFAGGSTDAGGDSSVIDYVTISTIGNATSFGNLIKGASFIAGCANSTRGLFGKLYDNVFSPFTKNIEYINISGTGNSSNFGDLSSDRLAMGSCASSIRGFFAGGQEFNPPNPGSIIVKKIDYVTIDTLGNGTNFGDLTVSVSWLAGCANATRGIFGGGSTSGTSQSSTIGYINMVTLGNASNFGSITAARYGLAACSGT